MRKAQQPHMASGYWTVAVKVYLHPVHNHTSKYLNHNGNKCNADGGNSASSALGKTLEMLTV